MTNFEIESCISIESSSKFQYINRHNWNWNHLSQLLNGGGGLKLVTMPQTVAALRLTPAQFWASKLVTIRYPLRE